MVFEPSLGTKNITCVFRMEPIANKDWGESVPIQCTEDQGKDDVDAGGFPGDKMKSVHDLIK